MKRLVNCLLLSLVCLTLSAQKPATNTAFQSGERLEYKLFFNWKFVWLNAGTATMHTVGTTYKGQPAFKSSLVTSTSKRLDKFFCMRDTLSSIVTQQLVPLYYRKGANEGGKYRLNEATYSYRNSRTNVHLLYQNPNGERSEFDYEKAEPVYDMFSMMLRARSFKGSDFKVGDRIKFLMADHRDVDEQTIIYRGIKNFTTEDEAKITYRCMVFSFVEPDKKGKEKEIITFYITDDDNHMPVRLDMFLRFGVAKAYLKTATGLRNPQTSIVKAK
ncbi:MAG: DUF3108 domain-containing protein [Bacteroidaceae bacterium]|nr:DUF3108 domain-containing protein [Bacteroidaceae bacterium]